VENNKAKKVRVTIVQPLFDSWEFETRLKKCERLVSIALKNKADFICLPELFPGRILKHSEMLWNLDTPIFFGHSWPPQKENDKWKNSYSLKLPKQENIVRQDKLVLSESEKAEYDSGDEIRVFEINTVKIGVIICHSLPFGPELITFFVKKHFDLVIVPALAPAYHISYWKHFLVVRAMDLGIPLIFVNYAGNKEDDGVIFGGGNSSIILPMPIDCNNLTQFIKNKDVDPKMNFLLCLGNTEEVITADIPLDQKNYYRERKNINRSLMSSMKKYCYEMIDHEDK